MNACALREARCPVVTVRSRRATDMMGLRLSTDPTKADIVFETAQRPIDETIRSHLFPYCCMPLTQESSSD
jgi:hypothetical protein